MIRPVNFTGIKNIGYAEVASQDNGLPATRRVLSMQLTDDKNGNDLTEYKKLLRDNPALTNKFGDEFVNIEMKTLEAGNNIFPVFGLLNGNSVNVNNEDGRRIFNFMSKLVDKVNKMKVKDFKVDEGYTAFDNAYSGLVYGEDIDRYLDGTSGKLSFFNGTGLTEKFDLFMNTEGVSYEDEEITAIAAENVLDVMYEPQWVKNGSHFIKAICDFVNFENLGS